MHARAHIHRANDPAGIDRVHLFDPREQQRQDKQLLPIYFHGMVWHGMVTYDVQMHPEHMIQQTLRTARAPYRSHAHVCARTILQEENQKTVCPIHESSTCLHGVTLIRHLDLRLS
jgi:hypothetical protein